MNEHQQTFEGLLAPGPEPEAVTVTCAAAEVAVATPVAHLFSYAVPPELDAQVAPGVRVRVPFGPRMTTGFVIERREHRGPPLKEVAAALEATPCLTPTTLQLGLWVARHYGAGPGESLQAVVPAAVRHGRGGRLDRLVELADVAAARRTMVEKQESPAWMSRRKVLRALIEAWGEAQAPPPASRGSDGAGDGAGAAAAPPAPPIRLSELLKLAGVTTSPVRTLEKAGLLRTRRAPPVEDPFANLRAHHDPPRTLTADQEAALEALLPALERRTFSASLLHGVTGSGKTEVYLRLLARALELGRGAILLVPEIALTPQTVERILGRVAHVAVLHSNQSDGDRARQWQRLRSGEVRVAVGPRSAVFAPIPDVGLIILDEEHETTFKQQQSPRYHAREAALERGRLEGALVLLGTATPSLESEGLVRSGAAQRLRLPCRVEGRPLPAIGVLDMRHQKPAGPGGLFSSPLIAAVDQSLAAREQVILFLNRRGFSTTVLCRACGWKSMCRRCAITLTHHLKTERLLCHYCGHEEAPVRVCPECRNPGVRYAGYGTERVAAAAATLFPGRRIARMDGETLRARGAPERIFRALKDKEIDILVGTQVLAKGFDIPGITLVGVVSADTSLLIPDFRSAERTFQLLCQVAGRTGRGRTPGRVLIQSYCPDHYAIRAAAQHDHEGFAREEMRHREALGYPPFGHLLRVVVQAPKPETASRLAAKLAAEAAAWPMVAGGEVSLLGPAPCPIPFLKGLHRQHVLFRGPTADSVTALLPRLPRASSRSLRVLVDRDPVALM